jgi:probable HAF family extracellular repeat protein
MRNLSLCCILCAALLVFTVPASVAQTALPTTPLQYQAIDVPGAGFTAAEGINNAGEIVGEFSAARQVHGFLLDKNGTHQIDFPGANRTEAANLNNRGDIVGGYRDAATGLTHGFLLKNGVFSGIDVPGAFLTAAVGINDRGQIVGDFETFDGGIHGFLLDDGQFTFFDEPAQGFPASTRGFSINNRGRIIGIFNDTAGIEHGFLLAKGIFTQIDVPGALVTEGGGLNDEGTIVGDFTGTDQVFHGYILDRGSFSQADFPGSLGTIPFQNNARDQFVGFIFDQTTVHGFLAQPVDSGSVNASSSPSAIMAPAANTGPACPAIAGEELPLRFRLSSACGGK